MKAETFQKGDAFVLTLLLFDHHHLLSSSSPMGDDPDDDLDSVHTHPADAQDDGNGAGDNVGGNKRWSVRGGTMKRSCAEIEK